MIKFFGGKICEKKNSKKSFQLESPKDFERNERKKKWMGARASEKHSENTHFIANVIAKKNLAIAKP